MKNFFLAISAVAVLVSCSSVSTSSKAGKSQANVVDTSWTLAEQVKGEVPTLKFEAGRVSGNAGCNTYFGEATLEASSGTFKAGELASTKKMCPNISVEQNYLKMLSEVNRYVVNGTVLELYKDNLLLMNFNKK